MASRRGHVRIAVVDLDHEDVGPRLGEDRRLGEELAGGPLVVDARDDARGNLRYSCQLGLCARIAIGVVNVRVVGRPAEGRRDRLPLEEHLGLRRVLLRLLHREEHGRDRHDENGLDRDPLPSPEDREVVGQRLGMRSCPGVHNLAFSVLFGPPAQPARSRETSAPEEPVGDKASSEAGGDYPSNG